VSNPPTKITDTAGCKSIAELSDRFLVTGANGFVGSRVVKILLEYDFANVRCLVRSSHNVEGLRRQIGSGAGALDIVEGNLQSQDDCRRITENVKVILHCAAGTGKSFAGCFMDSALATRNLIEATLETGCVRRFVNVSSLSVHTGRDVPRGGLLEENSEVETEHMARFDAYCFGKVMQDELVMKYGRERGLPWVILRPGPVFGPGRRKFAGRIGIDTFGFFIHIGGSNRPPLIYVDNCAEAIVLCGIVEGIEGESFIAVDDDRPTARQFLRLYKKHVGWFFSAYMPRPAYYLFSRIWEAYANWSEGQLPPVFNRREYATYWKKVRYSNQKLKDRTGWAPRIPFREAALRYFTYMKEQEGAK